MFGTNARRAIAGAGIAVVLAVGAGACGGGDDSVDKADLTQKVKTDSDLKASLAAQKDKDKAVQCVVDAAMKYGDKDKLKDYIDGKGKFKDVVVSKDDKEKANTATDSCAD